MFTIECLFICIFILPLSFYRMVDHFVSSDGQKVSYGVLEQSSFYRQTLPEFGVLLHNADPRLMTPAQRKSFFISILLFRLKLCVDSRA